MKNIELKLVAELIKNSRRSDRELGKILNVSQPTISRVRTRLEKEGYLREYTAIPDFVKLGFGLAAITLVRLRRGATEAELNAARQTAIETLTGTSMDGCVLLNEGLGGGYNGVLISFHKNYSDYAALLKGIKGYALVDTSDTLSFLIDLSDKNQYRNFTLSTLAKCI